MRSGHAAGNPWYAPPFSMSLRDRIGPGHLLGGAAALAWAGGLASVRSLPSRVDEWVHEKQTLAFLEGRFEVVEGLPTIPGYELALSLPAWVFGESLLALRVYTSLSLFGIAWVGFACLRRINPEVALPRALQLVFLPILFPFYFLVFTDALSLLLVLVATWGYLARRPGASGLAATLSLAVRQTNVIWAGGLFLMFYVRDHGFRLGWEAGRQHLLRHGVFVAGFAAFALFVLVNGGVAVGDRHVHPSFGLHDDNLVGFLLLTAVVLLPWHLVRIPEVARFARQRPAAVLAILVAVGALLVFAEADHPWNRERPHFFLRSRLVVLLESSRAVQLGAGLAALGTALSLARTRFVDPAAWILPPLAAFLLASIWMIEFRYYAPVLALWLVFQRAAGPRVEWCTTGWFVLLSTASLGRIAARGFFP